MSVPTIDLPTLSKQIALQEAQLVALKRELTERRAKLSKLTKQKQELAAQLRKVEDQIAKVSGTVGSAAPPAPAASAPPPAAAAATSDAPISVRDAILAVLAANGKPMPKSALFAAVQARNLTTTSKDIPNTIDATLYKLVAIKTVTRSADNSYHLAATKPSTSPAANGQPAAAPKPAAPVSGVPLTLNAAITEVLKHSKKPLSHQEVAERVLEMGYKSNSKDFLKLVWVGLSKLDTVEHIKGEGYVLKK